MSQLDGSDGYTKDTLSLVKPKQYPDCPASGWCEKCNGSHHYYDRDLWSAYLPHSCDEWIIGGKENIQAMIVDLQEALREIEAGTK